MKHQMKRAICIVSVCLVLAALVRAFMIETSETILVSDELMISSDEWSERQIELNGKKVLEYNCNIPRDAAHRLVLAVKTYNSQIEVLLNKEKIYTYEDLYDEKGYYWKWIKLPEDISEQTLTLRISYDRENATPFIKHNLYLGEHNAVLLRIFQKNLYGLFWGGITILTGIFVGLASLALRKRIVNDMWKGMHYLAVFILLAGIWILTDSSVMQFITGKTAFVSLVSFLSFMFMPYFFLLFIEKMMFDTKRIVRILSNLHLINTVVCVFLYLFRLLPLHQTLMGIHILIIISIGVSLKCAVTEIRHHENNEMKKIITGLCGLVIFGSIALVFFYTNYNSAYAIFYAIGMLIFIICLMRAALYRLKYYLVISAKAEEYQRIAHIDIMTHMENRLAFEEWIENSDSQKKSCVVMDINNLKKTNDCYGHKEGDRLIIDAAECILFAFQKMGNCYRIGGDEFVIVMENVSEEEILAGLTRMEQRIKKENEGRNFSISIAYGYSIQHKDNVPFEELFNEADANMYTKKEKMKKIEA